MTWIHTIPPEQAPPELLEQYQALYRYYPSEYQSPVPSLVRPDGGTDSIVAAHSLIPEAMRHMMSALGVLLQPDLPLTRRQHEMIASVVSAKNRCFY
jgi:hypothetical protein